MSLAMKTRNVIGASRSVYCHSLTIKQSFILSQIVSTTYQFITFSRYRENIIKRMEEVSLLLLFFKINTGNGYHFLKEGLRKGARWSPGRSLLVKTLFSNPFSRTEFKVILVFKVSRYALTVRPEFVSFSQGIVERAN